MITTPCDWIARYRKPKRVLWSRRTNQFDESPRGTADVQPYRPNVGPSGRSGAQC